MTKRGVPSAPALAFVAVLLGAGAYLTYLARQHWFFMDSWAFLLRRQLTLTGDESLLMPHNDHWVTLPIVVFRVLYHVVGFHHLPYAMVNIACHLLVCALLALMLKRAGADPWVCVLMTAVTAFMGAGALNILWEFQMVFLGPAALAMAAMVMVDRGEELPRFPVVVWLLLGAALMCSGIGVTMVAWVAAYTWLRRSFLRAVVVGLPPTLMYAAWYLAYGRGTSPAPPAPPGRIVPYMVKGMTNLWDVMLSIPWSGTVVLVLITACTVMARNHPRLRVFAAAGLLGLLFNYFLLAVTRAGWGVLGATSTRYLYIGVLLTLPAVGLTLQLGWEWLRRYPLPRAVFALAVGVLLVVGGAARLHVTEQQLAGATKGLPQRVVASAGIVAEGGPTLGVEAEPQVAPDIHIESLRRSDVRDRLPDVTPSPQQALDAAGFVQVAVYVDEFDLPFAEDVTFTRTEPLSQTGDCHELVAKAGATLELPPTTDGSQIALTVSQKRVLTQLRRDGMTSPRTPFKVRPDREFHAATVAPDARLLVTVPSGPVTVCNAGTLTRRR